MDCTALYNAVCSECFFFLTNEYPNTFVSANYSQMNVRINLVVQIFMNEYPNIFVGVVYSQMNVQINLNANYGQILMK